MHAESQARLSGAAALPDATPPPAGAGGLRLSALLRRGLRIALWSAVAGLFAFGLLALTLRYVILPRVADHREDIARLISQSLGSRVTIGRIDTRWYGIRPYLDLAQVSVYDREDRVALELGAVHTSLSWQTLVVWDLRLHRLEIDGPDLHVRRDAQGRLFVAGIELNQHSGGHGLSDWLLAQHEIVVRNATLRWDDAQRGAPQLALRAVNLHLSNSGSRHRFGLTAEPPSQFAAPIDLRGDFRGRSLERLENWRGEAFVALDRADLAAWRAWVDYPLDLPRGNGSLRLWVQVADQRLSGFTADVALDDVQLRVAHDLPILDLESLSGRVTARLPDDGMELSSTRLQLATRDHLRIEPLDFHLRWNAAKGDKPAYGEFTANQLDLAALTRLSGHLPLDTATRQRLAEYDPKGRVSDLLMGWSGDTSKIVSWRGRARLREAGLAARGLLPGFSKVSGTLEATQDGGSATLDGRGTTLDLPRVFPEPHIALDQLDAQVRWTVEGARVDVSFPKVSFANADVAGSVSGRYNTRPDSAHSPGDIELSGSFARGKAAEVWRYLPFEVAESVRTWVKDSVLDGQAEDIRLRIKGDLWNFPWAADRGGEFEVAARFGGVRLRYAADWPEFHDVGGSLLFHGERMAIRATGGGPGTLKLSEVKADIPNLLRARDALLKIRGRADGPTNEFLGFVNASPVAARLDRVTADMQASGSGVLALALDMPLDHVVDTTVSGSYQFAANQLVPAAGMPPLTEASGKLEFTDRALTIRNAGANLFGSPLTLSAQTGSDGKVVLNAQGSASVAGLRNAIDTPLLEHLSGSTPWRASVALRGQSSALVVDTTLQGITSSLPEPLNKTAAAQLPLHLEFGRAQDGAPGSDEIRLALDKLIDLRLQRHREETKDGTRMVVERGGIGVREAAPMADRGIAVAGSLATLDADAWRKLIAADGAGGAGGGGLPWATVVLRSDALTAFGQHFTDLSLRAMQANGAWQAQVESRELSGDLSWDAAERGRLRARLKHLALSEVKDTAAARRPADAADDLRELPGVDLIADNFSLRGKAFGKLELLAVNQAKGQANSQGNLWQIEKLTISNPDGNLSGTGQWRMPSDAQPVPETQLAFTLESGNAGKLLDRFGYVDAVRRGTAKLEGKLNWRGAPTSIDYPTLSGELALDAEKGQFNKLEPGVGRLLGVLSLQSLPRRVSLDFRDVFSDGYAFDSISGSMKILRGVMSTDDLHIRGPAARVQMSGAVNLAAETQDLRVKVQPTLSESVALGAAIANPVVGLATLVAQKVLKDPIEKIFSYEYGVTGTWGDPQVSKLASTRSLLSPIPNLP